MEGLRHPFAQNLFQKKEGRRILRCAAPLSCFSDQRVGTSSPPSKRYCAIFTSALASLQYQSAPIFFA